MKVLRRPRTERAAEVQQLREHRDRRPPKVEYRLPPTHGFTPEEARERRRQGFEVQYGSDFDLVGELRALAGPLAELASTIFSEGTFMVKSLESVEVKELLFRREVDGFVSGVHEVRQGVMSMLGHDGGVSDEARGRLREAVGVSAPVVSDADITSGVWLELLVAHVAPFSDDLAGLLGRSPAPEGFVSASSAELREVLLPLGQAAFDADRRIPEIRHQFAAQRRWQRELVAEQAKRAADERAAALKRVGLS